MTLYNTAIKQFALFKYIFLLVIISSLNQTYANSCETNIHKILSQKLILITNVSPLVDDSFIYRLEKITEKTYKFVVIRISDNKAVHSQEINNLKLNSNEHYLLMKNN